MKKVLCLILCICLSLNIGGCNLTNYKNDEQEKLYGIWLTYSELSCDEKTTKSEYEKKIETMFKKISDFGFNNVFVHVRAFSDAFYKSDYFPWSSYLGGIQGIDPGFDPLEIMVKTAKKINLKIHAWINPYRISFVTDTANLSKDNPARIWLEKNVYDKKILTSTGLYYNPASEKVRELIVNGVREIVEKYDVDGIHFDDYFYPQKDLFIDSEYYNTYLEKSGKLSQTEWRKENINILIKQVYSTIKRIDQNVIFGISPSGNIENNEKMLFADVKTWATEDGYVDYLCPQLYFGFENSVCPFKETADVWSNLTVNPNVKLYVGLGMYKYNESTSGEWVSEKNIILRQIEYINTIKRYTGILMFSYSSVFDKNQSENVTNELKSITNLFKL